MKKAGPKKVANTCKPVANKPLKKRPVHSENPKEKELSGEKNTEQKRGANKPLKKRPVNKENIKDKNTVPTEGNTG